MWSLINVSSNLHTTGTESELISSVIKSGLKYSFRTSAI